MTIRTQNGETQNVASQGLGNTGVTLGAVALGLGLLNGNGLGNGLLGGGCRSNYVTKDELDMSMKIAEKDSRIALLESEKTTDAKLVDVYREATARDREIRELIAVNKAEQAFQPQRKCHSPMRLSRSSARHTALIKVLSQL
ncbi:MAG: hypothetical protein J6Q60_01025 [Bacteroidaceae bacterium]|nr:hypothetical protein [Bacteroidaceae bacterium]